MEKVRKNYPDIAPSGPTFSRGVRVGNLLFIAGCTARGTDAQGKDVMQQLRVTLDRITRIVAEEGGDSSDIVKITTFVTSIPTGGLIAKSRKRCSWSISGVNTPPTLWLKSPLWPRTAWTWR